MPISNFIRGRMHNLALVINDASNGKITPDIITNISLAAHFPIALLIAFDHPVSAGILLLIFGLFDVLDGELARIQKVASPKGMLLDAATDRIKETLLFTAIAYNLSQTQYSDWSFLAVLALGGAMSVSYSKAKTEVALAVSGKEKDHHKLNRYLSEGIISFEVRMSIVFLGLIFNHLLIASALAAGLASIAMFERLIFYLKKV